MSSHKPKLYEGMFVISSKLSDDARKKAVDKILKGITDRGGEIVKIHDQGRRRLAYEIEGHKEGHYYLIYFNSNPTSIEELWQDYHLNEDLVRFLTVRANKVMEKVEFKPIEISQ